MRTLIFIVVVLFVTVLLTNYAMQDPGYVLITRGNWSIELNLTFFIVLIFLTLILLHALAYVALRIWGVPGIVAKWHQKRQSSAARQSLSQGLFYLIEGNWKQAEKNLIADLESSDNPVINYLGAAYACQQQGEITNRDKLIKQAKDYSKEHALGIAFTEARLQHFAGQYELELATLKKLREQFPKHSPTARQLLQVYTELHDWSGAVDVATRARKQRGINAANFEPYEIRAHNELLKLPLPMGSADVLKTAWQGIPKKLRSQPELIASYAVQLINQNEPEEAEKLLRQSLEREWNKDLITLYGQIRSQKPEKLLSYCERWLDQRSDDSTLLLTLAQLAQQSGFLDKALTYVETAIKSENTIKAHLLKGELLEQQGKTNQALTAYRKALSAHN